MEQCEQTKWRQPIYCGRVLEQAEAALSTQHPAELAKPCTSWWSSDRWMLHQTFITIRLPLHQACCALLRAEITPRALRNPGHGDPVGQKFQASADLKRAACGQGCVSQWQGCVQGYGLLAKDGCILHTSTMACAPAG